MLTQADVRRRARLALIVRSRPWSVIERKKPRDGDGDGFYDPDGKGPLPDRTPVPRRVIIKNGVVKFDASATTLPGAMARRPHRSPEFGRIVPHEPGAESAPEPTTMAEKVKHWHADVAEMDDLVESAAAGGKATGFEDHGPDVKAARVDFADGAEGVVTLYADEDQADSDQLVSSLARGIGISVPRVLRVDDDRSVADLVEGDAWDGDVDSPAAQRLGVLDLLAGIDTRDPATVRIGPDGVVPVQSGHGFRGIPITELTAGKGDKRSRQLKLLADTLDAAGPEGYSRATITARTHLPAALRDELLAELLATGDYAQVQNYPRGPGRTLGHNARFVRRPRSTVALPAAPGRAAADPPDDAEGLAFWTAYADGGEWTDNPLTDADARWLRQQLDDVRPDFAHLGRQHWWQFASDRLGVLAAHAAGGESLFAPRPLTELSTPELVALLRAHDLPATGSREALLRRLYAAGITA